MLSSFSLKGDKDMIDILTEVIVNFGLSSLASNVATTLITKSDKKILDKIGIGLGTVIVSSVANDICTKHIKNKIEDFKQQFIEKEDSDGGEISE